MAAETFIDREWRAWACPAGQGRSYFWVGNDITGTNDHRGTKPEAKGRAKAAP